MYYRDDEKFIYVLFDDRTWLGFGDTWNDTLPDDSCPNLPVPDGMIKPKRGFGKVWCGQAGVHDKIGAAASPEIGLYLNELQKFQRGMVFGPSGDRQVRINQVFMLSYDGTWQ
jgi:hypothetical protein